MKMKQWQLTELDPLSNGERRWSVYNNGPCAYLTCDEPTAKLISQAPAMLAALKAAWDDFNDAAARLANIHALLARELQHSARLIESIIAQVEK